MLMFVYNGVSFFNQVLDPSLEIKVDLTSGFLSAIDSFAGESFGDSVSAIDLGSQRITSLRVPLESEGATKVPYFNIVCFADKNVPDKKVANFLQSMRDSFFKLYSPSEVLEWDGNTLHFLPFKKVTSKILHVEEGSTQDIDEEQIEENIGSSGQEIVDGFALCLSDEYQQILKCVTVRVVDAPLEDILKKIAGDLSAAKANNWEGIIPLLDQRQLAYVFAKKIDDPAGVRFLVACYFIGDKYQGHLTKLISLVDEKFTEIFANFTVYHLQDADTVFGSIRADLDEFHPMETASKEEAIHVKGWECLNFKNIDQAVHALVVGTPIAIFGDDHQKAHRYMDELVVFAPHRSLRMSEFPTAPMPANQVDIVLISPKEEKKYTGFVVIDPAKKLVKNGVSNKFCDKMVKEILNLPDVTLSAPYLKRTINWLLSKAAQVRELSWGRLDPTEIKDIRGDLEPDTEKLVLELAEGRNSTLQNVVDRLGKQIPIDKLILDKNFVKFNDKKILVVTELTRDQVRGYLERLVNIGNTLLGPRMVQTLLA